MHPTYYADIVLVAGIDRQERSYVREKLMFSYFWIIHGNELFCSPHN